jgi:hypothetical protein
MSSTKTSLNNVYAGERLHKSFALALFSGFTSLLASVSDPWFLASYFLPLLLTQAFFSSLKKIEIKCTIAYAVFFIVAMSNMSQTLMRLPAHHFTLLDFDHSLVNAEWSVLINGRILNIFFAKKSIAYIASFILWVLLILYSFFVCMKGGDKAKFCGICGALSIAGTLSSFIVSYRSPQYISARFFVNISCFALAMCVMALSLRKDTLLLVVVSLFLCSSFYSYTIKTTPLEDQEDVTMDYIDFLREHKLSYGYGSFKRLSVTVNWMSQGHIHITPVFFKQDTGFIDFRSVRVQTMKSWHSDSFVRDSPQRQFVAISQSKDGGTCSVVEVCLKGLKEQVGEPDEILKFQELTLYVYNKRIVFR